MRANDLQGDYTPTVPVPQSLEYHHDPEREALGDKYEANQASSRVFAINCGPEEDQQRRK